MTTPEVLSFERQDGEGEDAWEAFQKYRDQRPPRRVAQASTKNTATLYAWAREWRWQDRALAYDRHVDGVLRAEREALLKQDERERTADQIAMLKNMEDLFTNELRKLYAESLASDMSIAKIQDLNKMLTNVITMRRLVHGESTEKVTHEFDLSNLSVEDLRKWRELQTKLGAGEEE